MSNYPDNINDFNNDPNSPNHIPPVSQRDWMEDAHNAIEDELWNEWEHLYQQGEVK